MSDVSDVDGTASDGEETSEESVFESESEDEISSDEDSAGSDDSDGGGGDCGNPAQAPWLPILGDDAGPDEVMFTGDPGPKNAPPADSPPIVYARLFLSDEFVDATVTEINRYATQWIENHQDYLRQHKRSRVHEWIRSGNTTSQEFLAFLGVTLNMGLNRKPNLKAYWDSVNPSQSTPWFKLHFSRDRFQLLLKFLHFSDNTQMPPTDDAKYKLYKLQPVIDHFQHVFLEYYNPERDLSIDESMVGYKGKTPHLRQYMPNKHHARFGVKLWCLSESESGYTSRFEVFKGAHDQEDRRGEGVTYHLVFRLLAEADLLNLGYHLGLDNYFSSPKLFLDLYAQDTTATGTVRSNRRGLPRVCLATRLRNHEVCERRKGPLLCVAYKDGKNKPVLLSTKAKGGFVEGRNRRNVTVQKPAVVRLYNQVMGGVDLSDAKLYCYLPERRTLKWTTKVAFALMGRAILNSYIVYVKNTSDTPKLSRYRYMIKVVEGLAGDFFPKKVVRHRRSQAEIEEARNNPVPPVNAPAHVTETDAGHKLEKLPVGKKRNCVASHDGRVRSGWQCPVCDVGLCPDCFVGYHERPRV